MGDLPKWDCPAKREQCCGRPFTCQHPWPALQPDLECVQCGWPYRDHYSGGATTTESMPCSQFRAPELPKPKD